MERGAYGGGPAGGSVELCPVCGRLLVYPAGWGVVMCPACRSVINVRGLDLGAGGGGLGQAECVGCRQVMVYHLGLRSVLCWSCGAWTLLPPVQMRSCASCGLFVAFAPGALAMLCASCWGLEVVEGPDAERVRLPGGSARMHMVYSAFGGPGALGLPRPARGRGRGLGRAMGFGGMPREPWRTPPTMPAPSPLAHRYPLAVPRQPVLGEYPPPAPLQAAQAARVPPPPTPPAAVPPPMGPPPPALARTPATAPPGAAAAASVAPATAAPLPSPAPAPSAPGYAAPEREPAASLPYVPSTTPVSAATPPTTQAEPERAEGERRATHEPQSPPLVARRPAVRKDGTVGAPEAVSKAATNSERQKPSADIERNAGNASRKENNRRENGRRENDKRENDKRENDKREKNDKRKNGSTPGRPPPRKDETHARTRRAP